MNWLTKYFQMVEATAQAQDELAITARELLNAHTRREACRVELRSCDAHIDILQERHKRLEAYAGAPRG